MAGQQRRSAVWPLRVVCTAIQHGSLPLHPNLADSQHLLALRSTAHMPAVPLLSLVIPLPDTQTHHHPPCHPTPSPPPPQDVVLPFMALTSHDRSLVDTPLNPLNSAPPRNLTLFFAGGLCGSGKTHELPPNCSQPVKTYRYSGGVRQQVSGAQLLPVLQRLHTRAAHGWTLMHGLRGNHCCAVSDVWDAVVMLHMAPLEAYARATKACSQAPPGPAMQVYLEHHQRPGYKLVLSSASSARDYMSSRYCLAAAGGGWGKRGGGPVVWCRT